RGRPPRRDRDRAGRAGGAGEGRVSRREGRHRGAEPAQAGGARDRRRRWRRRRQAAAGNNSAPFIRPPVGTARPMGGGAGGGVVGYRQLPISALPEVEYPTIVVSTMLPGASADTMVSAVTTPLERQLGQIPSLAQLTSVSSGGSSQITLQFELGRDIDAAE